MRSRPTTEAKASPYSVVARTSPGSHGPLAGIAGGDHAYFVHSYHLNATNESEVLARADYGGPVTAMVGKDTAIGTQFHPEKSQRFGLALISNFLRWKP